MSNKVQKPSGLAEEEVWSWIGLARKPSEMNDGEAPSSMTSLDMLEYPGSDLPVFEKGDIAGDSELMAWLGKDLTRTPKNASSASSETPIAGQRILFGAYHYDSTAHRMVLPFGEQAYAAIKSKLGLPSDFQEIIAKKGARSLEYTTESAGQTLQCFIYKFVLHQPAYYHLILSYSPTTHLTHGLLLSMTSPLAFPSFLTTLKLLQPRGASSQPLLLAVLVTELLIDQCAQQIEVQDEELNRLEEEMGQHESVGRRRGNWMEVDFEGATRSLNFVGRTLGVQGLRLGGAVLGLEKIGEDSRRIVGERLVGRGEDERAGLERGKRMMEGLEAGLISYCRNQELRVRYEEKRVQTQSAAIYSFVAQKDAKANIELAGSMAVLATEARGDTKVMKTIAVLGMFFLPGTFVAAVFAMPLIDWSGSAPVVNRGFKYYWAVAVPLTLLVLLSWAVFTHKQYWRKTPPNLIRAKISSHDIEKAMMGHCD